MAIGKEKEFIVLLMVIDMMVNGKITTEKEKEFFIGLMVIDMRVNLKMT